MFYTLRRESHVKPIGQRNKMKKKMKNPVRLLKSHFRFKCNRNDIFLRAHIRVYAVTTTPPPSNHHVLDTLVKYVCVCVWVCAVYFVFTTISRRTGGGGAGLFNTP